MNETKSNNQTVHWSIKYFIILSLLILTFILAKIKIINEDRNEQLSVESTATLSSTQDEIKWSMAPPKIEVMSDWSSFRLPNGLFRTNIRYIKIDGRLAIQAIDHFDNANRIIFILEKADEPQNPTP